MPMQFTQLDKPEGLKKLNGFLTSKSYIEGYSLSDADLTLFKQIPSCPEPSQYPNVYRWYVHIASKFGVRALWSGIAPKKTPTEPSKTQTEEDDDDLFGDDDDEEAAEAAKKRAETAKNAKEAKNKKKVVERSQVVVEVKPWDKETDLEALAIKIKSTKKEGLTWGEGHKLVDVAYGIKKLLVQCVILDDMVSLEDITDIIEQFEDSVQSVDIASMNKI
uniref:EF1 guanine nucleotide exchange domaincontaining protein putative n=1 Tax=Albugo laibachii Nc14 TaxID=890382 RepID=F0WHY5_9STRA|nr:EF1 guanine nucleotide exchange domaincontaining protein putative [Albugo laibachii Nc14]|eukprot:CCA20862.1 EF1 guanine nucleotide exchange domaincontaining protein putative [Albugo laibachii Nc14]